MNKLLPLILILFTAPCFVFANPTNLECEFDGYSGPHKFSVDINEESKEIIHTDKNTHGLPTDGLSYVTVGVFTSNIISYKIEIGALGPAYYHADSVEINRINFDLKYTLDSDVSKRDQDSKWIEIQAEPIVFDGICKVRKT